MTQANQHRLLRRQLKRAFFTPEEMEKHKDFFIAVNDAYKAADSDVAHLENILEVNSQELFRANQELETDNAIKTKEALAAKSKLDRIVTNINDIIFETDEEGKFTYVNESWERFSGVPVEQTIGQPCINFLSQTKFMDEAVARQLMTKKFDELHTIFATEKEDKSLTWWELRIKKMTMHTGEAGIVGSLVDVTKLKQVHEELTMANEAKNKFLSAMSHEIRTPLNAVIGISNILMLDDPKQAQMENLKALKFSSKHLLNLINDLLDFNKLSSGKINFSNSDFNLQKELTGIVNSLSYTAREKGLEIFLNIDGSAPLYVKGDSLRLSQVLTNLLGNAIKFTNTGSVQLNCINCSKSHEKNRIRFEVIDTGIGIPKDKLNIIFDRFTQAEENTTKRFGGTGLGLAISKSILNMQGSEIIVESELGKGSKFWFEIEFDVSQKEKSRKSHKTDDGEELKGMRILVVDDNKMNLLVASQFLQMWGTHIDEAMNGEEAVSRAKENQYDAILMDLQMPVLDGYGATDQIRAIEGPMSKIPIIALTASVSNEIIDKVSDAGMDDYLTKPFDPKDLYAILLKHFGNNLAA